ncbi:MAG: LD-carboxypeptidase [SAR324 cluster bacterium]|nr:LD-carboxypeptidase [SAR324 cluster bacterium]
MILPQKLKIGDTVGLVAPCSHQARKNQHLVAEAISVLERWGLQVKLQPGHDQQHFYLAGTDQHRSKRFQDFYTDPNIKALFITRGGYGASRMLRYLDRPAIAAHQKIVVGSSDATSLLLYLQKFCQVVVYHGPGLATSQFLQSLQKEQTQESLRALLFSEQYPSFPVQILCEGHAKGLLTGGCLSLVVASLGTFYEIETEDRILFLEDVDEAPYRIDRMLAHLQNAGKFGRLKGLVFGEMTRCGEQTDLLRILEDIFHDADFPIVYGVPSGHGETCMTLSLGAEVEIETNSKIFRFLSP